MKRHAVRDKIKTARSVGVCLALLSGASGTTRLAHADDQAISDQIVDLSKQAVALSEAHKDEEASLLYYKMLALDNQLDPRNSRKRFLYHQRGATFFDMENYRTAYDDETRALAQDFKGEGDPTDADLYTLRARCLMVEERYTEAEADLKKAIASKPNAYEYTLLAFLYEARGMNASALEAWKSAADLDAQYKASYQSALDHAAQAKKDETFDKTPDPDADEDDISDLIDEGFALQKSGDYDAAALRYEKVIASAPDNTSGYKGYADTMLRKGSYDAALPYYNKAIALGMNTAPVWGNYALLLYYLKDWETGRQNAAKAIALDPKSASAWWTKALCESRLGLPEAEASRAQAVALDASRAKESLSPEPDSIVASTLKGVNENRAAHDTPHLAQSLMVRAEQLRSRGRMAEWRAVDRELEPLLSKDALNLWVYGMDMARAEAPEEAKAAYRKAIALDSKDFNYRLTLARQLALENNWAESLKTLDEAAPLYTHGNEYVLQSDYRASEYDISNLEKAGLPTTAIEKFRAYLEAKFTDALKKTDGK